MRFCPNCGIEAVEKAKYCHQCGTMLLEEFHVRETEHVRIYHPGKNTASKTADEDIKIYSAGAKEEAAAAVFAVPPEEKDVSRARTAGNKASPPKSPVSDARIPAEKENVRIHTSGRKSAPVKSAPPNRIKTGLSDSTADTAKVPLSSTSSESVSPVSVDEEDIRIHTPDSKVSPAETPSSVSVSEGPDEDADMKIHVAGSKVTPVKAHRSSDSKEDGNKLSSSVNAGETHIWSADEVKRIQKLVQNKTEEFQQQTSVSDANAQKQERSLFIGIGRVPVRALLAILCAIALLLTASVLVLLFPASGYTPRNNFLMLVHDGSGTLSMYRNGVFSSSIATSTTYIDTSAINNPGTVVAALTRNSKEPGVLYSSTSKKITFVSDKVISMQMASDSGHLVYLILGENGYDLYLFDGKSTVLIDHDVEDNFCISPDGRSVGYTKASGGGSDHYSGYVYTGGKISEFGIDRMPFAIADQAEYIYYFRYDNQKNNLYVRNGLTGTSDVKLAVSPSRIFFNNTLSEVVFTDQNVSYISEKAGEKIIISQNGDASVILPYGCSVCQVHGWFADAGIYSTRTFRNSYLVCGDSLFYLSKRIKPTKLASDIDQVYLSNDGETVFYLKSGDIRSSNANRLEKQPDILASNVYSFTVTADGSMLYYISSNYELMQKQSGGASVMLADNPDIINLYSRHIFNGSSFVYAVDNRLCIAKGDVIASPSMDLDYLSSISANGFCLFVQGLKNGENVHYMSGDGSTYVKY